MAILEVGDDGMLHVPSELLANAKPHARFESETVGNVIVLRPAGLSQPFWRQATPSQRAAVFRQWAESERTPVPDLPVEYLRREHIYD